MCIVALAWQLIADRPMILLSNRDEFYAREALPLMEWPDSNIIAGQDVQSHGTWLGITKQGKWAVITNFREGQSQQSHERSRGLLITDYLNSDISPMAFAQSLQNQQDAAASYAGFNLIVGNREQAVLISNRGTPPTLLPSGLYTLSNGLISESWPKMEKLRLKVMQEFLPLLNYKSQKDQLSDQKIEAAWQVLQNTQQAEDADLPQTGVPFEWEKALSSIFIELPIYGTRVSNLLILDQLGYEFIEKTHVPAKEQAVVKKVGVLA
jgi:uncharacterized protein with NRDE domain